MRTTTTTVSTTGATMSIAAWAPAPSAISRGGLSSVRSGRARYRPPRPSPVAHTRQGGGFSGRCAAFARVPLGAGVLTIARITYPGVCSVTYQVHQLPIPHRRKDQPVTSRPLASWVRPVSSPSSPTPGCSASQARRSRPVVMCGNGSTPIPASAMTSCSPAQMGRRRVSRVSRSQLPERDLASWQYGGQGQQGRPP